LELKDGFAAIEKSLSDLRVGRWIDRVGSLLSAAALLGVMARGFKWIARGVSGAIIIWSRAVVGLRGGKCC
jgi:hypothetical protein